MVLVKFYVYIFEWSNCYDGNDSIPHFIRQLANRHFGPVRLVWSLDRNKDNFEK